MKAHQWQNQSLWCRRRRDHSTWVARRSWSERNSSQNLGYLVNPENADERKGVEIACGNSLQTASKSEVGYSQVSRQENAIIAEGNLCMGQLQKQRDQRALSNSNSSGPPVQGADSKTRVSK